MCSYILSRLFQSIISLFFIVTITFFLARLAPGGPFLDEKSIPDHLIEKMEKKYGFDKPILTQYGIYLKRLIQGDLGPSFGNKGFSVNEIIKSSFPISSFLGLGGLIIAILIGIPIGIISAAKHNSFTDNFLMSLAILGICLPTFVIAPILAEIFALKLNWLDVAMWDNSSAWVLAILTLGLYYSAYIARLTRGSMLDILNQDFIRTAYAKGLSFWSIMFKHAFKGGISPVIAYLGPAFASLIGGSFVIETIFTIPGLGQHFIKGVFNRDFMLINGTVTVFSILILSMNLIVDILQNWLDPKTNIIS